MSEHWVMGLEEKPMDQIRQGKKFGEFRPNKLKWKDIEDGDTIEFQLRDSEDDTVVLDNVFVEVLKVVRRPTFRELLEYVYSHSWGTDGRTLDDQCMSLEQRYPVHERNQYPGVVAFRIRLIQQDR